MKNGCNRKSYQSIVLLFTALLMVACAPVYKTIDLNKNTGLVWPERPDQPRISHVASFYHPEQLGIKKGFFSWLGDLISGEEERRLIRPMAITKTIDNVLFIADPGVKGVHRFDLKNKRYKLIRLQDDKPLPSPVGITADNKGDVFFVDSELAQLFRIDKNNDVAIHVPLDNKLVQPTSIAINNENATLLITDTGAHQVKLFSIDGMLKSTIGKRGKGKGEFNYPTTVWLDHQGKSHDIPQDTL